MPAHTRLSVRISTALLAATALVLSGCTTAGNAEGKEALQAEINEVTSDPRLAAGTWSILAIDASNGDIVYESNPDAPLVPGSIAKTFTTGTALAQLGPDSRVTTTVQGLGELTAGVLNGDLVLVGAGDFSFGLREQSDGSLEYTGFDHNEANTGLLPVQLTSGDPLGGLKDLARQLQQAGITQVTGDVIVDNRLFEAQTSWPDGRIDSIWVNENTFDVVLTPGTPGQPPAVEVRPALRGITVQNDASTVAGSEVEIDVTDQGGGRLLVSGQIGAEAGQTIRMAQVSDPVGFARMAFTEVLAETGITVDGAAETNPAERLPAQYPESPLAARESATLAERVRVIQKISFNRGADLTACLIAVRAGSTECQDGLPVILDTIEGLGTPPGSVYLFDAAGSIDYDRISAAGQVGFLRGALDTDWGQYLYDAMPISGVDGSLASLGKGTASEGMIHAKTGSRLVGYPARNTLFYAAQAYSGYLTAASGRELVFTVIFNSTTADSIDEVLETGARIGDVALALQQHG